MKRSLINIRALIGTTVLVGLAMTTPLRAANLASDNAGNYSSWSNGSNGGTGFGVWTFNNDSNGSSLFAGNFLGDSTAGSGNINSSTGNSFALYANPNGAFETANRAFTGGSLTIGQDFQIQLAVNYRNGGKGINFLTSTGAQFFNFNAGNDDYTYQTGGGSAISTGFSYQPDSVFTLTYQQQDANTALVTILRTSAANTSSINVTLTATNDFGQFTFYNSNTDNGAAQNNLYFNNLLVDVPEPSTCLGGAGIVVSGLMALRRSRKSRQA